MFGRPQLVLLFLVLLAGLLWLRLPGEQQQVRTALLMGTLVEVKINDEQEMTSAVDAAFAEMGRIETLLSSHLAESEISQLSFAHQPLQVSPETAALLQRGQQFSRRSDGAFDLTLGALKRIWAIEAVNPQVPGAQQIEQALRGIGPQALQIDGLLVSKVQPQLLVDLGGIAKGYAVDRALEVLRQAGVASAAINAGGDIGLLGSRGDGQPWRIGIQHPRNSGELLTSLLLTDQAVVTSGDYERFFEQAGVRYHHIFDPRSGYPARACQSVTVVAETVETADALATAAFVLGPVAGLQLLEATPQVEGLLVAADGSLHRTSGMGRLEQ